MVRPDACASVADGVQPPPLGPGTTSLYAALNVALLNVISAIGVKPSNQIVDSLASRR